MNMKIIFVTGLGRSGTTFLGNLLKEANNVSSRHEFIGNREFWLLSWYLPAENYAVPYLNRYVERIHKELQGRDIFIDVNSYLQNAVDGLRSVFPDAEIVHLVRNPKKVIPSLYVRRNERDTHQIPKEKLLVEQWLAMDKFEQICWNWANTTERLLKQDTKLLKFENIVSDYSYLEEHLLQPMGIKLTKKQWLATKNKKVNKTRSRLFRYVYARLTGRAFVQETLGPYGTWTKAQQDIFDRHCGALCQELGYN